MEHLACLIESCSANVLSYDRVNVICINTKLYIRPKITYAFTIWEVLERPLGCAHKSRPHVCFVYVEKIAYFGHIEELCMDAAMFHRSLNTHFFLTLFELITYQENH